MLSDAHLHIQQRLWLAIHAGEIADLGQGLDLGAQLYFLPLGLEIRVARMLAQALPQGLYASALALCQYVGIGASQRAEPWVNQ